MISANVMSNMVLSLFTRMRQIAAKIGGDAGGAPLNNSAAPEGFPYTAQKRQLEDAGRHVSVISPLLVSLGGSVPCLNFCVGCSGADMSAALRSPHRWLLSDPAARSERASAALEHGSVLTAKHCLLVISE